MSKQYKAFMIGMGFGALLMFILLFPSTLTASDENGDEFCLAQNIYFEAGNQPLAGKIAVAHVVMNRLDHYSYPGNICGVVYDAKWKVNWAGNMMPVRNQCQFSWFCDGQSDTPLEEESYKRMLDISDKLLEDEYNLDITEGADHYFATWIEVEPEWSKHMIYIGTIDNHKFYKSIN